MNAASTNAASADPALAGILERYLHGTMSAPVTLMQLLIETEDFVAARTAVMAMLRDSERAGSPAELRARAKELADLTIANAAGAERIAAMLRADVDTARPARSVEEGIAFSERLFDWSVQQSEEASVALYSLGNPRLLEMATAEIVAQLERWDVITSGTEVLDIGCGIGRLLVALAPKIRSATGIDVSAEMVKVARRRCAPYGNITVIKGDGHGLTELRDESFELAIAVDSFPYLRQSGYALVERFFAEVARVLRRVGNFVILNYSYNEDDVADAAEVRTLAEQNGFDVIDAGSRPFELWDGLAFRLRKRDVQ
jgi:cyclopropane fatty-acyl-phospholipid synthase-like methyltransferase